MKTININGFEVPEPLREEPEQLTKYWCSVNNTEPVFDMYWEGRKGEKRWLQCGFVHLTKEAAELHATALVSFTKAST